MYADEVWLTEDKASVTWIHVSKRKDKIQVRNTKDLVKHMKGKNRVI